MNTEHIIKSFTSIQSELSRRVDVNVMAIAENSKAAKKNEQAIREHDADLTRIDARLSAIESGTTTRLRERRAPLSDDYLRARRAIRLWPVEGLTEEEIWEATGDFIHGPLGAPQADIGGDDIESVERVVSPLAGDLVRSEVLVTLKDKRTRDMLMVSSVNLASQVDSTGRPTAGTRLEIPRELTDTFRLLNRFGARLRARHGAGTKRHVKFDDYTGSLYANVKLPGDTTWTRVLPEMARADLGASVQEEDTRNRKRFATKLLPGPRERLAMPISLGLGRAPPLDCFTAPTPPKATS